MHERRSLVVLAALLAIVALSVGAGALPAGPEAGHGTAASQQDGSVAPSGLLVRAIVGVLVVGSLLAAVLASRRRNRRSGEGRARRWTAVDAIALVLVVLLLVVLAVGPVLPGQLPGGASPGAAEPGDAVPTVSDGVWLAAVTLAVLGAVGVLLYRRRSGGQRGGEEAAPAGGDDDVTALGRTAGRAVAELDASADDNAVYWAWQEMTALLDIDDPDRTTPREFAARATATGLARDDVEELTRLFETVRYGDRQATADRERRAREVFRRIETTYAGGADTTDPDTASGDETGGA